MGNITEDITDDEGLDTIYINLVHFFQRLNVSDHLRTDKEYMEKVNLILKMDICSLTIHEMAHVVIRKATNNFNMATPEVLARCGLPINELEFGRIMEKIFFVGDIDWYRSRGEVNPKYIRDFLNTTLDGSDLPNNSSICIPNSRLRIRAANPVRGMDWQMEDPYFD